MTESSPVTARLLSDRRATVARLERLRHDFTAVVSASMNSNVDDEHDPEGATIAFERAQIGALIEQGVDHLAEVEVALARVADGSYARCMVCGRDIPSDRLAARPTARTCVACAS